MGGVTFLFGRRCLLQVLSAFSLDVQQGVLFYYRKISSAIPPPPIVTLTISFEILTDSCSDIYSRG